MAAVPNYIPPQEPPPPPARKARPVLDWIAKIPYPFWAPAGAGALILLAGGVALWVGQPWLFASLGPTAYEQAELPQNRTARIYNVIVGHFMGLAGGFLAVALLNVWLDPNVLATGQLTAGRVYASALGIAFTALAALLLRASHPPAGATCLLVTLGAFTTKQDCYHVIAGVLIVACAGEVLRRLRLRREDLLPGQTL